MAEITALRTLPQKGPFKEGDVLVLFGELFSRGYANGLMQRAQQLGLKVIRTTVGRREKDGTLRPLNSEELAAIPDPVINIPLEAGFDLELANGKEPFIECLKNYKTTDWENFQADEALLAKAQEMGRQRFTNATRAFLAELDKMVPAGKNVYFAHLMAGGVPRTRVVMPVMNRVFKGMGDRHLPSERLWNSGLGRIVEKNFMEVSAETFGVLLRESEQFRSRRKGQVVAYSGYGYHGTEVLLKGQYTWQSYAPYLQGWAKMKLEDISREWNRAGVACAVYNCPEILTNSSSIFQGVELPLYPLIRAIEKEGTGSEKSRAIQASCRALLKNENELDQILDRCEEVLLSPEIRAQSVFEKWPQHNTQAQMEKLLGASEEIFSRHKDPKNLMTFPLSELVFSACGHLMMDDVGRPQSPVSWINHDVIAKWFQQMD